MPDAWGKPRLKPDWFRKELCPDGYAHPGLLKALQALDRRGGGDAAEDRRLHEAVVAQAEKAAEDILGFDGEAADLKARSKTLYELADLAQKAAGAALRDLQAEVKEAQRRRDALEKLGGEIKQALREAGSPEGRARALERVGQFLDQHPAFVERYQALPEDLARPLSSFARSADATADAFAKLRARLGSAP